MATSKTKGNKSQVTAASARKAKPSKTARPTKAKGKTKAMPKVAAKAPVAKPMPAKPSKANGKPGAHKSSSEAAAKLANFNAVTETCKRVEALLSKSSAYRKVDAGLYVIKQGSSLVMISVHQWKGKHVVIRLTAQLVKGVSMEVPLALELLELNAAMRFGAFAFIPKGNMVVLCHTLLERDVADAREFLDTLADFAIVADEYDDRIAARYGGSTMQDLLEEATMDHIREGYEKKDFLA